ncbi:hypothetical protein [Halosegnis longus]|uniref:hypothetical protein n=1 Tax=Halosegnis longus TaxID=2216012 RepID=UPI00096A3C76|nr:MULTISPECIES: hypothetical protein [Halobacteriales]
MADHPDDHAHAGQDDMHGQWTYEYRLRFEIGSVEDGYLRCYSEWTDFREGTIEAAKEAEENGMAQVHIETRRVHETRAFEGCPE